MNSGKIYLGLILILICCLSCGQKHTPPAGVVETYRNPVIAGDFPDPTVIRAGDTYYAATSSSEWAQPYRLFRSEDLVNWEHAGPIFNEVPEWLAGSFWAPELYYHNETFYVYYTARRKSDKRSYIGVATSKDPSRGFEDHGLIIEWTSEAIDAYVIDLDNKPYITWKAYGLDERPIEILGAELSEDRLKVVGEAFSLVTAESDNWEQGGIEGQCIVRNGSYLYMFYAGAGCCGKNCTYATGVARATSLKGPWEKYSGNPILHGDDTWKCSGHGTLVETPDKRFFYLYHAYDVRTNIHTGRQVLLDEIIWDGNTGWPRFRYGTTPSLQAEVPHAGTIQQAMPGFKDDFGGQALKKEWIWDVSKPRPQTALTGDGLVMQADNSPSGSFLGLKAKKGDYTFEATIGGNSNVLSGIGLYGSSDESAGISVLNGKVELWRVDKGQRAVIATAKTAAPAETTVFVTTRGGNQCQFGWSDGNERQPLGPPVNIDHLPQWDRPACPGIQAYGNGKAVFRNVTLRWE